jgi:hypothetical protein
MITTGGVEAITRSVALEHAKERIPDSVVTKRRCRVAPFNTPDSIVLPPCQFQ